MSAGVETKEVTLFGSPSDNLKNEAFSKHHTLKKLPKSMTCLITVIVHFLIGILFCTDAGNYWVDLFNNYSASIVLRTMGK